MDNEKLILNDVTIFTKKSETKRFILDLLCSPTETEQGSHLLHLDFNKIIPLSLYKSKKDRIDIEYVQQLLWGSKQPLIKGSSIIVDNDFIEFQFYTEDTSPIPIVHSLDTLGFDINYHFCQNTLDVKYLGTISYSVKKKKWQSMLSTKYLSKLGMSHKQFLNTMKRQWKGAIL